MAGNADTTPSGGTGAGGATVPANAGTTSTQDGYDFTVDPTIEGLDDKALVYLSGTLRDLISHRIDGINYAEGRRSQLAAIGGAIAAAGVALLSIASGVEWVPLRAVYIELSLASVALGLLIWIVYALQTNYDYPFKTQLKNWKWFYHQALPDKTQFGPGLVRNRGKQHRESELQQSGEQWPKFAQQARGLSAPKVDATQDLKQLYQLHVNERYKNLFLTRLRNLLVVGLLVVVGGAVATFCIALAAYDEPDRVTSSDWRHDGIRLTATWKETGEVRTNGLSTHDAEFRVRASLTNLGEHELTWTKMVMLDQGGDPIPAQYYLLPKSASVVEPGETLEIEGYFWIAGSDRQQVTTLMPQ
jgi:hypothetical protein